MPRVRFYVPTRGRCGQQSTVKSFQTLHSDMTIVCPADEVETHRADFPNVTVVAQPDHIRTIGAKREWVYKTLAEQDDVDFAWQLDDDLKFKQFHPQLEKFVTSSKYPELNGLDLGMLVIHEYYHMICKYEVLGLGTSYFAPKGGIKDNYHLGFAFGFSRMARQKLLMNRLDVFEDIDYTLQMLRAGIRIGVVYDIVVDQIMPDAPGGVSGERNQETIRRDLEKLISFHPGLVSEKPVSPGRHPAACTKVLWAKAAKEGGLK